jgi:hypothetical protein
VLNTPSWANFTPIVPPTVHGLLYLFTKAPFPFDGRAKTAIGKNETSFGETILILMIPLITLICQEIFLFLKLIKISIIEYYLHII